MKFYKDNMNNLVRLRRDSELAMVGSRPRPQHIELQDYAENSSTTLDIAWSTLDKVPGFVDTVLAAANAVRYPVSDIGIYLQPQHQGTSCHCEFNLPYVSGNKIETDRVRELLETSSEALIKQGAYFSRPYGIWADMV